MEAAVFYDHVRVLGQLCPCPQPFGHGVGFHAPGLGDIIERDLLVEREYGGKLGIIAVLQACSVNGDLL